MKGAYKRATWFCCALLLSPLLYPADEPELLDAAGFARSVEPFLAENCYLCHNAKLKKGGLNLQAYNNAAAVIQFAIARGRSAPARRMGWVSD